MKSPGSASEDVGKRKKKALVLVDSTDSESDGPFVSSAASKKPKKEEPPAKKESSTASSKLKTKPSKTLVPETPLRPVDIGSVFGDKPIHRSKDPIPEKRKRTVVEDHSDDDFEATLKQLDQAPVTKRSKILAEEKANHKSKSHKSPAKSEKSPSKAEKSKSPAKAEKSQSPVVQRQTRSSSRSPQKKPPHKESGRTEVKKEPTSPKKKSAEVTSPKKTKPDEKIKEEKASKNVTKELDSNSNKKTPKSSNKKFKGEPMTVTETPKKASSSNDDSVMESPSFDPLEKRKQQAENYRKFLSSHKEGAKNPGSKPVPEVINKTK